MHNKTLQEVLGHSGRGKCTKLADEIIKLRGDQRPRDSGNLFQSFLSDGQVHSEGGERFTAGNKAHCLPRSTRKNP